MSIFKCKMCGGTIEFEQGATVGVCDHCGTKQTLPKTNDDVIANLFNRANNLRLKCEFDKAEQIYERIVQEDDSEAEAHWGIVLCKYGIEYVDDPATGKKIPTCHRTLYESVISDPDYQAAVDYSDALQQSIYESEARAIDRIQKDILAIVKNEKPFDVFLCYKETDENGKRTVDSAIANDIYHQLTQEGFKVFYAAITLEDKLGQAYEPYIFAALHSAKVMLVIGTKPEYFSAVWVRNEWSRYLKLMKTDRSKLLIPCYRDMDAYELPEDFAYLQAQDMSKIGFINDVVRGIKKVAAVPAPKAPAKEPVVNDGSAAVAPLLKRAFMFLEDGDWQQADEYCEKVLDQDPENAQAYLGKLMAELKIRKQEDLMSAAEPFENKNNYQKALRFGDEALKAQFEAIADAKSKLKALYDAIKAGDAEAVAKLLKDGADPNCIRCGKNAYYQLPEAGDHADNTTVFSPLTDSIRVWPNDEIAELLINAGADVNYSCTLENVNIPILIDAIIKGNVKLVNLLLEKGADPNCERKFKDGRKVSALYDSIAQWPNDEIAELLINAGADVNYSCTLENANAPILNSAIMKGNVKLVKLLLEKGADPNCERKFEDGKKFSALSDSVAVWPNDEIAERLISAGADVNYCAVNDNEIAYPVLSGAVCKGNIKLVKLLLEKGADPNCELKLKNGDIFSVLSASIHIWPNDEIAELLINAGADVNYCSTGKNVNVPILIDAIIKGNVKLVNLLLEKGADPNCERTFVDGIKYSALGDSVINWPNYKITELLIDAGADVNYINMLGEVQCPVMNLAIGKGNVKVVKLLLEKGADPNCERKCEDGRKFSPLFDSVAVWPNDEIAERLISAGADVNYCAVNDNEIAYPVLSCAVCRGNVRIVSMLLRKGANPNCERVFKNGGKISALRDSIVTWPNNAIVNLLAAYTTDFPRDIRGLSVRRTDLSKESIKALRKAGCLIPLF